MLVEIVSKAKELNIDKIYVFSHEYPDGDAIGSSLALVECFRNLGFTSKYVITKENMCLKSIFGEIETTTNVDGERFIAVICDTSTEDFCENDMHKKAEVTYKIDHHLNSERFADYNMIDNEAGATCQILADSVIGEGFITPTMATYLYTGIYTDTGRFEFSLSKRLFLACAKLMNCGADVTLVTREVKKIGYFKSKMMGYILSNYTSYGDGIVGLIVKREECEKNKFNAKSIAKSVNTLKDIDFSDVFFIASQDSSNTVYVELRSAETVDFDVCKIARNHGGGGHFHASGFNLNSIREVHLFINELKELYHKSRS